MVQQFFQKIFYGLHINFSFLFKTYLQQYFREVVTVIFKFQITKEVNIHNTIQKMNSIALKPLFFLLYQNSFTTIKKIISRTIN